MMCAFIWLTVFKIGGYPLNEVTDTAMIALAVFTLCDIMLLRTIFMGATKK